MSRRRLLSSGLRLLAFASPSVVWAEDPGQSEPAEKNPAGATTLGKGLWGIDVSGYVQQSWVAPRADPSDPKIGLFDWSANVRAPDIHMGLTDRLHLSLLAPGVTCAVEVFLARPRFGSVPVRGWLGQKLELAWRGVGRGAARDDAGT